jgi:hypothetical protein
MRRTLTLLAGTALVLLALVVPGTAAQAADTDHHTAPPTFAFTLLTPNTATAPQAGSMAAAGDWIAITGHGSFTPATGAVRASGVFVHHNADGTVHCLGTWTATALTGWTDFGGAREGRHGGIISMLVKHRCATMGQVHTGIPMTVTSARNGPAGTVEGVTVGDFTVPTGGHVLILADARR